MTPIELKTWRQARGLTQEQAADMAGVSRLTIIRWEKGKHSIPQDALTRLEASAPAAILARPAVAVTVRWRAYPWALRDYTYEEMGNTRIVPIGCKLWRVHLDIQNGTWDVMQKAKTDSYHHSEPHISLPLEAFPDPMGLEAAWARDVFEQRLSKYNSERAGLRQAMKDAGIPEDDT